MQTRRQVVGAAFFAGAPMYAIVHANMCIFVYMHIFEYLEVYTHRQVADAAFFAGALSMCVYEYTFVYIFVCTYLSTNC